MAKIEVYCERKEKCSKVLKVFNRLPLILNDFNKKGDFILKYCIRF